jgi:hypothetical protein
MSAVLLYYERLRAQDPRIALGSSKLTVAVRQRRMKM